VSLNNANCPQIIKEEQITSGLNHLDSSVCGAMLEEEDDAMLD